MIYSMTGYGRAMQTLSGRELVVELRAVNNRFLDCTVKLPRLYTFAEDAVKQCIKKNVKRGKVDVFITINNVSCNDTTISLNRPVLESYLQALRQMAQEYCLPDDISVMSLTRFADVLTVQKEQTDEERFTEELLSVTREALESFNRMRAREGEAMERDIRARTQTIRALVGRVEERSPETVAAYRARLEQRMQEVLEQSAIDESRILTEAAIFADKIAVDEETVRLRSHLDQLGSMLDNGGDIGRKLDFLMQEMNREANTIGSKCNDLELAGIVVEIKAELEKIREQIQNIE